MRNVEEQNKRIKKQRKSAEQENKVDMAGRIPTMSGMYNRNFRLVYSVSTSQGKKTHVEHISQHCVSCPRCKSQQVAFYDHYKRQATLCEHGEVRHLVIHSQRYQCRECNYLFRRPIEGLVGKRRSFEVFRQDVCLTSADGVNNKRIARKYHISESTVERIVHEQYALKEKEALSYSAPIIMGIDEHSIHRGHCFATTIVDLKNHRVYDVIEGRAASDIERVLMRYKDRERVKVVCMDLSSPYRRVVKRCFPNAKILADRFHVIKMIQYHFLEFAKRLRPEIRWKKAYIYPLRKKRDHLNAREKEQLEKLFNESSILKNAYELKEDLCDLLRKKNQRVRACRQHIRKLKDMMRKLSFNTPEEFQKMFKTLREWFAPIIRMWRYSKNNGMTEGFHRKMKLIQRRAYGYRNFANYRLRVLIECGGFNK